jgi:hypothetical protein
MRFAVVSFQHENWDDDAGMHDPVILELNDADWDHYISNVKDDPSSVLSNEGYEYLQGLAIESSIPHELKIEWIGTIWWSYE